MTEIIKLASQILSIGGMNSLFAMALVGIIILLLRYIGKIQAKALDESRQVTHELTEYTISVTKTIESFTSEMKSFKVLIERLTDIQKGNELFSKRLFEDIESTRKMLDNNIPEIKRAVDNTEKNNNEKLVSFKNDLIENISFIKEDAASNRELYAQVIQNNLLELKQEIIRELLNTIKRG